jgi:hypothetical protein
VSVEYWKQRIIKMMDATDEFVNVNKDKGKRIVKAYVKTGRNKVEAFIILIYPNQPPISNALGEAIRQKWNDIAKK